ncbi:MAG: Zn-dependent exopeptidase M28 [Tannerella sp.]|jgi:hypothetical protein|nr:Zn-dependent exopeptidase M28 [Tannerella sp.]
MKKIVIVIISISLFSYAFSQESAIRKIVEMGNSDNQVMRHLDVLTNRFGGRPVGSDAYSNAAEWLAGEYRRWGLEVEMHEAGSVPVGFNRGAWFGRMLGGDVAMNLHFVTPSYTSGTKGLQRGHVVHEPKSREEFNRMKQALKGAWVLIGGKSSGWAIDRSASGFARRDSIVAVNDAKEQRNAALRSRNRGTDLKDSLETLYEEPALYLNEMMTAGILGTIQAAPVPLVALYDYNLVRDSLLTFDRLPELPDIKLDIHQYDVISQMVTERRVFELEFDIRNHFKPGPVKYYTVIGKLKGYKYPDEYVIMSGHLDSFDAATGGVDCGSGLSSVIEAARMIALSGAKPKRSMLFIAFAAEEFGLLGAKAWVRDNKRLLGKISNVFNRDGGPLAPVKLNVHPSAYKDFVEICKPVKNIGRSFPFEVTEIKEVRNRPQRTGGTDATVFAVEGVPTITFQEEDVNGYNFSYGEIWHSERDLYTKSIPEYQEYAATVMAITALGVANLDHLLSREGMYK